MKAEPPWALKLQTWKREKGIADAPDRYRITIPAQAQKIGNKIKMKIIVDFENRTATIEEADKYVE